MFKVIIDIVGLISTLFVNIFDSLPFFFILIFSFGHHFSSIFFCHDPFPETQIIFMLNCFTYCLIGHKCSFILLQSFFSVCFILGCCYFCIFWFTDLFFCSVWSAVNLIPCDISDTVFLIFRCFILLIYKRYTFIDTVCGKERFVSCVSSVSYIFLFVTFWMDTGYCTF